MICSEPKTWHWELVPKHDIKMSSQANAHVLLAAINAMSNLFSERLFSKNEQMVEQDEESKQRNVSSFKCTHTKTWSGGKR